MNRCFSLDDLLLLVLGAFAAVCGAALGDASRQVDSSTTQPSQALLTPATSRV
jgi:hypothetical protein